MLSIVCTVEVTVNHTLNELCMKNERLEAALVRQFFEEIDKGNLEAMDEPSFLRR